MVFDGRNDQSSLSKMDCLLQHYVGQRVKTTTPVFDPDTVTLMDFNVSQHHGITFLYVLPFSEREALVEPTIFSKEPLNVEVYEQLIQDYLRNQLNVYHYDVVFQEKGIIPMTVELLPPKSIKRIIPIGTSAGMVRASTGYGFLTIQKWSKNLVDNIFGKQDRWLPKPYSSLSMFLDRIFLSYLKRHPLSSPAIFLELFRRVPPERLVRFLSDQANLADLSAVILSMPTIPFMGEAFHVVHQKD
jgi:lycopene beta-cyclase